MINIGDRVEIKSIKRNFLAKSFDVDHNKLMSCGVNPYHLDKSFIVLKTYGNNLVIRVYGGKATYMINKNLLRKIY